MSEAKYGAGTDGTRDREEGEKSVRQAIDIHELDSGNACVYLLLAVRVG